MSEPTPLAKASYLEAAKEFGARQEWPAERIAYLEGHFDAYLDKLEHDAAMQDVEGVLVPQNTFWLLAGDYFIGEIRIRRLLTEALQRFGGNIGYAVRPSERRQGYATLMLKLALERAQGMGLALRTDGVSELDDAADDEQPPDDGDGGQRHQQHVAQGDDAQNHEDRPQPQKPAPAHSAAKNVLRAPPDAGGRKHVATGKWFSSAATPLAFPGSWRPSRRARRPRRRPQAVGGVQRGLEVAGDNRSLESINERVGARNGIVQLGVPVDASHRAEYLLRRDPDLGWGLEQSGGGVKRFAEAVGAGGDALKITGQPVAMAGTAR